MTLINTQRKPADRRRFLKICAAGAAGALLPTASLGAKPILQRWSGVALGAPAEINLLDVEDTKAKALFRKVEAEIRRLEQIFSLYLKDSELARLNRTGRLRAPSLELIELLGTVHRIHTATEGAFDPTIQSLWALYAAAAATGQPSSPRAHASALRRTGFGKVRFDPSEVRYEQPGMAMTLNGIAQGYITDRVAALLTAHGYRNVVVDLGEVSANGNGPEETLQYGAGWPVTLRPDPAHPSAQVKIRLMDTAVASSASAATTFDSRGTLSHILDPRTGQPVEADLTAASVIAPTATLADGLSTAALVTGKSSLGAALSQMPATKAFVVQENGTTAWMVS